MRWTVLRGDCLERMLDLPEAGVDAIVTDPPYELGFMARSWDLTGVSYRAETWQRALRVLKPGGHLLAFGGTRTSHRLVCAIEDAGFEIRDCLMWLYGTGFPKSLDVSKAIDKAAGAERELIREEDRRSDYDGRQRTSAAINTNWRAAEGRSDVRDVSIRTVTAPATDAAKQWQGWGTALKPSYEPIVLARKKLDGTVAANVLKYGVGGINIDGCRIETAAVDDYGRSPAKADGMLSLARAPGYGLSTTPPTPSDLGRWPANLILDEQAAALLDEMSGELCRPGNKLGREYVRAQGKNVVFSGRTTAMGEQFNFGDRGGASRFFYVAKASRAERDAGCEDLPLRTAGEVTGGREEGSAGLDSPRAGAGRTSGARNTHPTVKPVALMRWLVRLVTPPGGIVLDPFMGSGSTGLACLDEGFRFIGIEQDEESLVIAKARLRARGRC